VLVVGAGPSGLSAAYHLTRLGHAGDDQGRGLDESTGLFEARRCMSCGNCFGCDNRHSFCPDNAIVKLGDG
jgi:flavin-dependent dehydrogenase